MNTLLGESLWHLHHQLSFDNVGSFALIVTYILSGLLGVVIGSFLNVVIYRLPNKMSLSFPPSHCTTCDYKLKWYDNIPIISYFILGGKCRNCKTHFSFRYTVVEALNMVLWLLCAFAFAHNFGGGMEFRGTTAVFNIFGLPYAIICMIACSVLICIAFIDLDHTYIPDRFQIMLAVLGVLAIVADLLGFDDGMTWLDRVIGGVGAGVLFIIIYFGGRIAYKREAMGIGDIKLVAAAGLLLGWKNMILAILIGTITAAVVLSVIRAKRGDEKNHEYPLGPFLVLGILIAMFAGEPIINGYLHLMGIG